jgi:hypothetical protein
MSCTDERNRRIEHIDAQKNIAFASLGAGAVKNQYISPIIEGSKIAHSKYGGRLVFLRRPMTMVIMQKQAANVNGYTTSVMLSLNTLRSQGCNHDQPSRTFSMSMSPDCMAKL